MNWFVRRRWPQEFDGVLSGDGAGRVIETVPFHQMVSGSPIAMAVEHSARNAATQHSRECLLVALRLPVGNNFIAGREAANVEALFVCGATPKTLQVRRVSFLDAFLGHCYLVTDVLRCVRNHVRLKTTGRILFADYADYTDPSWNSNSYFAVFAAGARNCCRSLKRCTLPVAV